MNHDLSIASDLVDVRSFSTSLSLCLSSLSLYFGFLFFFTFPPQYYNSNNFFMVHPSPMLTHNALDLSKLLFYFSLLLFFFSLLR